MMANRLPTRAAGRAGSVRVHASTMVQTQTVQGTKSMTRAQDVETAMRKAEARAKAMIAIEEAEVANRTKVKITFQKKLPLGSTFKLVGTPPEFGRFTAGVAPFMTWTNGDTWTWEGPLRPGRHTFKVVVRHPDMTNFYEEGDDRLIEIPTGAEASSLEFRLDGNKMVFPYLP